MYTLIREGGWPMWFLLGFGIVTVGNAARFAIKPDPRLLGLLRGMSWTTLFCALNGAALDLAAVGHNVSQRHEEFGGVANLPWILLQGFAESMSPLVMGFAFLTLTAMLSAVGQRRLDQTLPSV